MLNNRMYLSQNVETLAEAEHLEGIAPLVKKKKTSPAHGPLLWWSVLRAKQK